MNFIILMIKIIDIEYKYIKINQLYTFFNNINLYYSIVRKPLIYLIFDFDMHIFTCTQYLLKKVNSNNWK